MSQSQTSSQGAVPAPNLNPAAATGVSLGTVPPRVGALLTEKTRGTESVTFRIPAALKAIVNKIVSDPRYDFNGTFTHAYIQAVAVWAMLNEPYFSHDREFEAWAQDVKRLDAVLALQEPVEAFRERLSTAEERVKAAVAAGSLDYGFQMLEEAVRFVTSQQAPLRDAVERMLRDSQPFKDLVRALLDSERYGLSDELDRLQKFMGGAL